MRFLRQNTAVIVTVGPFYDKTDGVTIETALTITNERITLTADTDAGSAPTNILDNVTGATSATANDLNYITGNDAGMMQLELAAADTNRVGRMMLSITDAANHVPVFHEFFVLPQAIYDWLTGVIVPLPANVTTIAGSAVSTSTAQLGVNVVQAAGTAWASGAITAAAIADNAIDMATLAADLKTGSAIKANVETITANAITATAINTGAITAAKFAAGAIDAAAIAAGAIDNATFAADVGSTAYATNIIALAADKAIVNAALGTAAELAKVPKSDSTVTWNATALASIQSEAQDAITASALATAAALATVDDFLDTEIAALTTELAKVPKSDSTVSWNATALAAINAEVDTALNTAIPGTPTANSVNERIAAIDDLVQASGAGDLAALKTTVGAAGAGLTAVQLAAAGIDAVWDRASTLTLSFEQLLTRAYQMINNKMNVTDADGTVALRNIGDTVTLATGSVTDNSTTTTRLELTWA